MFLITDIQTELPTEGELDKCFKMNLVFFEKKLGKPLYIEIEISKL